MLQQRLSATLLHLGLLVLSATLSHLGRLIVFHSSSLSCISSGILRVWSGKCGRVDWFCVIHISISNKADHNKTTKYVYLIIAILRNRNFRLRKSGFIH